MHPIKGNCGSLYKGLSVISSMAEVLQLYLDLTPIYFNIMSYVFLAFQSCQLKITDFRLETYWM